MKKFIFLIIAVIVIFSVFAFGSFLSEGLGDLSLKNSSEESNVKDEEISRSAKVVFVGDMMFDRWIRQVFQKRGAGFIFQNVEGVLKDSDLVVGNLEGPITSSDSVSLNSEFGSRENYIFTFPAEVASELKKKNICLVSLGNNHILNFGQKGLEETEKYLQGAGVDFFGDPGFGNNTFEIKEINGTGIAFLNYNQFARGSKESALKNLEEVKKASPDFVVLYAHWGVEYEKNADEKVIGLAHEFIDKGVDLIIGSHSHVVQQKEVYHGKTIYYSLGNFIFDQYFDSETQKGLVVEVDFDLTQGIILKEHQVEMKSTGQTIIQKGA